MLRGAVKESAKFSQMLTVRAGGVTPTPLRLGTNILTKTDEFLEKFRTALRLEHPSFSENHVGDSRQIVLLGIEMFKSSLRSSLLVSIEKVGF